MKSVYWRPQKASPSIVMAVGLLAISGLLLVESNWFRSGSATATAESEAMEWSYQARELIRTQRQRLGLPISTVFDPHETGLVGSPMSLITSKPGDLKSKQLATHPQFPAVVVRLLHQAGVRPGDRIAVGYSGSLPGLNLSVLAAIQALELRPVIISSVMSSQYGANEPELVWLDVERLLVEQHLGRHRSQWASIGGPADRGFGMTDEAIQLARAAIQRNQVEPVAATRLSHSVEERWKRYSAAGNGSPVAAYINVGGGVASSGGDDHRDLFRPGLNYALTRTSTTCDCVMSRFLAQGVPVIHLSEVDRLASQFQLKPCDDRLPETQQAGLSDLRLPDVPPNRTLAILVIVTIVVTLRGFVLSDIGYQLLRDFACGVGWKRNRLRIVGDSDGPQLMA